MTETIAAPDSGYRYLPGVFQYSCGVGALPGFALERVRFSKVVPLKEGFARIAETLKQAGRPLTAFAACELRSPAPFTEQGFRDFNEIYIRTLEEWGIMKNRLNPIARSNVCPKIDPPSEPGFYAFSFTTVAPDAPQSFVIAGSGESAEGKGDYRDNIVRYGDTSPSGMLEKAKWVLGEMERRMQAFGGDWSKTTGAQLYTVHDVYALLGCEFGRRGVLSNGLTWHLNRPPVEGLEFEMDCRRVHAERVIDV